MSGIWISKLIEGISHPNKIRDYFKDSVRTLSSRLGDGAWAPTPQTLKLYVNAVCNAQCLMCDIGLKNRNSVFYRQVADDRESILTVDDCERLADEVKPFKPQINIHGLEPLLHPDILAIVSAIKIRGLKIHLVTNGILLPDKADDLIRTGVDTLTVSVDGPRDIHDAIRGKGAFDKAMQGLRRLIECRNALQKRGVRITCAFTICEINQHGLIDYARQMLEAEKADAVNFLFLSYVTATAAACHNSDGAAPGCASAVNTGAIDPAAVDAGVVWEQIQALRRSYPRGRVYFNHFVHSLKDLEIFLKHPQSLLTSRPCTMPWKSATILSNGEVIINNRCFAYSAGNIHKEPLLAIWNGKQYRRFRRDLRKAKYFPACYRCCGTYRAA